MSLRQYVRSFGEFFKASPRRSPGRSRTLGLELLENRLVPTAIPNPVAGVLTLNGDPAVVHDQISFTSSNQKIHVTFNGTTRDFGDTELSRIRIFAGSGDDTINIESSVPNFSLIAIEVDGGSLGTDTLNVNEAAGSARTFTVNATQVTRPLMANITYSNLERLNINANDQGSTINVDATAAGVTTTINANAGPDTINVCQLGKNLDAIQGPLVLNGGDDGLVDQLFMHDQNQMNANRTMTITNSQVTRVSMAAVSYSGLEFMTIQASDAGTTFNVENTAYGLVTTINANGGPDTINVCPQGKFLDYVEGILVVNGGTGVNRLSLYDQNNIFDDTYLVQATTTDQNVTRPYMSPVMFTGMTSVALFASSGHNTINVISSLNVTQLLIDAGGGNDLINGGDANEILQGGAGNDTLYGNGGRDLLVGGYDSDGLYGGLGDDLLIGGHTTLDAAALLNIMAEWTRTDLTGTPAQQYSARIASIRNGGGLNGSTKLIYGQNVFNDNVNDTLYGNGDLDWFFADRWTIDLTRHIFIEGDWAWDQATGEVNRKDFRLRSSSTGANPITRVRDS